MQRELFDKDRNMVGVIETNDPTAYCPEFEKLLVVEDEIFIESKTELPKTEAYIETTPIID